MLRSLRSAIDDALDALYEPNAVFSQYLGSASMTFFSLFSFHFIIPTQPYRSQVIYLRYEGPASPLRLHPPPPPPPLHCTPSRPAPIRIACSSLPPWFYRLPQGVGARRPRRRTQPGCSTRRLPMMCNATCRPSPRLHTLETWGKPRRLPLPAVPDYLTKLLLHISGHRTLSPPRLRIGDSIRARLRTCAFPVTALGQQTTGSRSLPRC